MIKTIRIENFKGQSSRLNLDQFNLFLGPNGSGKSTWLQGASIGVLGYLPGNGEQPKSTFCFSSSPEKMTVGIRTEAIDIKRVYQKTPSSVTQQFFVDGTKMTRGPALKKIHKLIGDFPVMLDLNLFMGKSPKAKLEFLYALSTHPQGTSMELSKQCQLRLLQEFCPEYDPLLDETPIDNKDYQQSVKDMIQDIGNSVIQGCLNVYLDKLIPHENETGDDMLRRNLQDIGDDLRTARRDKTSQDHTIRTVTQQMEEIAPEGSPDTLRSKLESTKQEIATLKAEIKLNADIGQSNEAQAKAIAQNRASLGKKVEEISRLEKTMAEAQGLKLDAQIKSKKKKQEEITMIGGIAKTKSEEGRETLKSLMESSAKASGIKKYFLDLQKMGIKVSCPECSHVLDLEHALGDHLKAADDEHQKFQTQISKLKKETDELDEQRGNFANEYKSLAEEIWNLEQQQKEITADSKLLASTRKDYTKLLEVVTEQEKLFSESPPAPDIEQLQEQLRGLEETRDQIQKALTDLEDYESRKASIEDATLKSEELDQMIDIYKRIEFALATIRSNQVQSMAGPLTQNATRLLRLINKDLKLEYVIEDKNFDIMCANLNGKPVPFQSLSGGEQILYSCAQLAAFIQFANPPLKLIQGELGEISGPLAPQLLTALKTIGEKAGIQMLFASCHSDFDHDQGGWASIEFPLIAELAT